MTDARSVSFWLDDLAAKGLDDLAPRPALPGDVSADVCVIGAGFTGLWTAVSVLEREPSARVACRPAASATAAGAQLSHSYWPPVCR